MARNMVLTYLHFRILKFPLRLGFSTPSFSLSHRFSDDHDVVCEATCKSWGPNRYQNQYKKGFECKNAHELSMLKMVRGTTMTQEIQFFMKQSSNRRTKGTWHLLVPCSSGSSLFLPDQQPSPRWLWVKTRWNSLVNITIAGHFVNGCSSLQTNYGKQMKIIGFALSPSLFQVQKHAQSYLAVLLLDLIFGTVFIWRKLFLQLNTMQKKRESF